MSLRSFANYAALMAVLLASCKAPAGDKAPGAPRPNVLLITLDTLRADHLPVYGYEGVETPHLDALAADGALFLQAVAPPGGPYDLFTITEAMAALGGTDVAIRFAVGADDHLLDVNRQFHAHLEALGMAHDYAEVDGGHEWRTVNRELPGMLAFLAAHLAPAE